MRLPPPAAIVPLVGLLASDMRLPPTARVCQQVASCFGGGGGLAALPTSLGLYGGGALACNATACLGGAAVGAVYSQHGTTKCPLGAIAH